MNIMVSLHMILKIVKETVVKSKGMMKTSPFAKCESTIVDSALVKFMCGSKKS